MRRSVGHLRLLFAGLSIALALPSGLAAQTLEEREQEYRAALFEYEAAVAGRAPVQNQFYEVLDSLTTARSSGDQQRIDALEGRLRDMAIRLDSRDSRVAEMSQAYEDARARLLTAFDQRLDSLGLVLEVSTDAARRDSVRDEILDLQLQYVQVQADELNDAIGPQSMILPAFRSDPRDTPATLLAKAEFLEGKAEDFQREIDRVDELLERYEGELRLQRFTGDVRANRDRFGDTQVPVRGSGGAGRTEQGMTADTTGVDLESLPPADAIVALQRARASFVLARDQTRAAAANLRAEARGDLREEDRP